MWKYIGRAQRLLACRQAVPPATANRKNAAANSQPARCHFPIPACVRIASPACEPASTIHFSSLAKSLALRHLSSGSFARHFLIARRQLRHADVLGGFLHNVPNRLHRHAISPCPSNFVDPAEQFSSINSSCGEPIVEFSSHPIRNWNCSNVASLANQINNGPMLFALLEVIQSQRHGFMPSQAAGEQQSSNARSSFPFSR
jgi:hypothetical protein